MQTVADLCKTYIEHRRCNIKRSTAARYEGMMKKYIIPQLGDMAAAMSPERKRQSFTKKMNGRKVLLKKVVKDMHGKYHNEYIYEIVRGDDDDQP